MQENCVQSTGICLKMIKPHIREPDAKCSEVVQRKDDLTGELSRGVGWGWSRLCLMKSRMSLFEGTFRLVGIFRTWGMRFFVLLPSFLGMMPRHSQSTPSPCPRSVPGSSPIGWCPEHFTQDSSWSDTRTTSTGSFRWWGLVGRLFAPPRVPHPIPEAEPRHPWAESHFSCFYPPPHSFYHHWRFVAISQ